MFDDLSKHEKIIVYEALIHAINTNSGIGFLNNDQRHPAYMLGADEHVDEPAYGDSPANNTLYRMIVALAPTASEELPNIITTWKEFCERAVQARSRSVLGEGN